MQRIYLNKETTDFPKETFDVVLSPTFYWIKKEELSLSKQKKRAIAPSLFESELPSGEYDYFVKDNHFIAFDRNQIKTFLEEKNVSLNKIRRLYFAEYEYGEFLTEVDGLHFEIPGDAPPSFSDTKPTHFYVSFHSVDKNLKAVPIVIVLSLFTILNVLSYFSFSTSQIQAEMSEIRKKYTLPQTTYQLLSEVARYKEMEEIQMDLREKLYKLTRKRDNYEKIVIEKEKIVVEKEGKKVTYE